MKKVYSIMIISLVLICSHLYCIGIGAYGLPPFSQIQSLKNLLFGGKTIISYGGPNYAQRKSLFEKLSEQKSIVMVGDSITAGCEWNELFSRNDIANRGINRDTTTGVLNRIDSVLKIHPSKVFLMIGTNDIGSGASTDIVVENYKKIILKLKSSAALFVQSTLFRKKLEIGINTEIGVLNERIKSFCLQNNVIYIDLNPALAPKGYLDKNYGTDGVHLNGEGYLVWKREIEQYF